MRFGAYGIYDTICNLTSFCIHSTPHIHSCMSPLIFLLRCLFKAVSLDKYAFLRISPLFTNQDHSTMFLNASLMPHVCISKNSMLVVCSILVLIKHRRSNRSTRIYNTWKLSYPKGSGSGRNQNSIALWNSFSSPPCSLQVCHIGFSQIWLFYKVFGLENMIWLRTNIWLNLASCWKFLTVIPVKCIIWEKLKYTGRWLVTDEI